MATITINGVKMVLCTMLLIVRIDVIFAGIVLAGMYNPNILHYLYFINMLHNVASIAIILEFIGLISLMSLTFLGQAIEQGRKFRIMTLALNGITALAILISEILIYRYVELTTFEIFGKVVSISVFIFLVVELWLSKNKHTVNNVEDAGPETNVPNLNVNHNEEEDTSSDDNVPRRT